MLRRLCNKIAWLSHGNLVAYGETESVLNAYRSPDPAQQTAAT
jgi:ABC-type polysaccharide/polyol phosphate transport system ATPase subunit